MEGPGLGRAQGTVGSHAGPTGGPGDDRQWTTVDLMAPDIPLPDAGRLSDEISSLAAISDPDAPGWTRCALTEIERSGRLEVERRMRRDGLAVHVDGAGNIIGVLEGRDGGRAIGTGSHTDTVRGGGRYDGIVGVLGALEAVACLRQAGIRLRHDLWVIDFYGEEPNSFGVGALGSRAVAGKLTPEYLQLTDETGRSLGEALETVGIETERALSARWQSDELAAFVECHVEQGPFLEQQGCEIGVVSSIAGIERAVVRLRGRRDHAGTMPVELRHDAACAAAEVILAVERLGREGGVATTGRVVVEPGAANVVPESALLWIELRSTDPLWLVAHRSTLEAAVSVAGASRGVEVTLDWPFVSTPTPMNSLVMGAVARSARELGRSTLTLPSGAGHDSTHIASLAPTGMVFVPSHDGRSHCPEEFTEASDIAVGVQVLATTLVDLDTRLP